MARGIGSEFMRLTRHAHLEISEQRLGRPEPPPVEPAAGEGDAQPLPDPGATRALAPDFHDLVTRRVSRRRYAESPLTQRELSFLLWCTQGVKDIPGGTVTLRTVPSAGARHAFETLLLVRRVEGLAPGLYRFDPPAHALRALPAPADLSERLTAACYGQACAGAGAVAFLWVAIPRRMTWRYGERGYRYLHLDAGHVAQNLYLAAEAIGAGACAIAAFDDQAIDALLGLDGERAFLIYLAAVGKKP